MPSGKQILQSLLKDCSSRLIEGENVTEVTDRLKAGLLLHGSTPDEMWFHVERMGWISESDDGEVTRQGLGLKQKNIFLSDLFEYIVWDEIVPEKVLEEYPDLTLKEFNSATHIMWCLLSSLQYFEQLKSVENEGRLDINATEKLLSAYKRKLAAFRNNPDDIIGMDGFRG